MRINCLRIKLIKLINQCRPTNQIEIENLTALFNNKYFYIHLYCTVWLDFLFHFKSIIHEKL